MRVLFNKIESGRFLDNQKIVRHETIDNTIAVTEQIGYVGLCNWQGFDRITINNVQYLLPEEHRRKQYFFELRAPTFGPVRISGLPESNIGVGSLFLGVMFDKLKMGKSETRKVLSTNKVKQTLTGINYVSDYGIHYMKYAGQCPPLLDSEGARRFLDLIVYNNSRNVIIQFECSEFGEDESFVYGQLTADTMTTQGLNIYGTKMSFTERY